MSKLFSKQLPKGWKDLFSGELEKTYFKNLTQQLEKEYNSNRKIYPSSDKIFRALQLVDYDQVKVVILGQDPYHGDQQAIGLSFGVPNELFPKPPSLKNIFKELQSDLELELPNAESNLTGWAEQGVLLLNTVLTVQHAKAFSHRNLGWEVFTDQIIRILSDRKHPIIFILWGSAAQKKKALIAIDRHYVIEAPHPSPLSCHRGFFGSRPFSKTNEILVKKMNQNAIDWSRITAKKAL